LVKELILSKGRVAIVDDEDFEALNQYKWSYMLTQSGLEYAIRRTRKHETEKPQARLLHRQIMNTPRHLLTDHINGNGLDNRRENLRICTPSQNNINKRKKGTTSTYKGVYFDKARGKFRSHIIVEGKSIFLGRYETELESALAYDRASVKYHGEYANNNGLLEKP